MITVIGGAAMKVKVRMLPKEETMKQPLVGDTFDYDTLNVQEQVAQGDDIEIESCGCGFNIACHLADKGAKVAFASVVGDDALGLAVLEQLKRKGVEHSWVKVEEGSTPIKVEVLNILNDPQMGFMNSAMFDRITVDKIKEWKPLLEASEIIVIDGSLPKATLEYIAETYGNKDGVKLFFDPAGYAGAINARNIMGKFYCVMPGRVEAEAMLKRSVLSPEELAQACEKFENEGVKKSVITIRGGGLYYKEGNEEGVLRPDRVLSFAATSGAGDVVSATIVLEDIKGSAIKQAAESAMKAAAEFLKGKSDERLIDIINENSQTKKH